MSISHFNQLKAKHKTNRLPLRYVLFKENFTSRKFGDCVLKNHPTLKFNKIFPPNLWLGVLVFAYAWFFTWPLTSRIIASEHHVWLVEENWQDIIDAVGLIELPRLAVGLGMMIMSAGLLWRARLALVLSLTMLVFSFIIDFYTYRSHFLLLAFNITLFFTLFKYWQVFNRSSFAASSMYTIVSVSWLLFYAIFGTLYLGNQFKPPIEDLVSAFYFSVITMATVGYGDILPIEPTARLFVISIVIFGVTVFATAISALAGPVIGGNLRKFIQKRAITSMRKNHVIVCGATPLAMNVVEGLLARGHHVTAIVMPTVTHQYPSRTDVLIGDASTLNVLKEAGLEQAQYLLALKDDDAENAFIILAAKELVGNTNVKTVAVVNESVHLSKIQRVHPDIIFSPQMLGSEILTRTLAGEVIDGSVIMKLFFNDNAPSGKP
jgi:voltage-gated potassium channel